MKVTARDRNACWLIGRCGHIGIDRKQTGKEEPALESEAQVTAWRLERLKALGLVSANGDGLLDGISQTWGLTEAGKNAAKEVRACHA